MLRHVAFVCAALFVLATALPVLAEDAPPASGTLTIDDKTYKMTHAAAYESNFVGEADVYMIVFSNKAIRPEDIKRVQAGEKDGDTYDYPRPFMKLEFKKDGKLLSWSGGAGNSSAGRGTLVTNITSELKINEGHLSGSASKAVEEGGAFSTGFDVKFDVALPGTQPAKPKPATGTLDIKDLPIPKDATNVAYHKEAEFVTLTSPSNVKTITAELTKSLKAQGWENDRSDVVTPRSGLVRRKRGSATLEIILTPADTAKPDKGSEVKIFTKGLSWEGK